MKIFRPTGAMLLTLLLTLFTLPMMTACSSKDLVSSTSDIADALRQARPIVKGLVDAGTWTEATGTAFLARLEVGETLASDLKAAFIAGKTADAMGILALVISSVDNLVQNDSFLIPAGPKRVAFLAALAGANLALHFISNRVHATAEAATPVQKAVARAVIAQRPELARAMETIEQFRQEPEWGRTYSR